MKRILFVDDEPMLIRGLQRALLDREDEWGMTFVTSGQEALAALAKSPFDALVTDMRMPGMNGAELLDQVWKNYPRTARIVLSGEADQELVLQCSATAHQYLSKPCDSTKIEATLDRVLNLQCDIHCKAVTELAGRIKNLPSSPKLFNQINQAIANESADLETIGALVKQDIAMTAKLLKLVNSAFFGLGREVSSAVEAVNYVGTASIKAILLTSHVFDSCTHLEQAGLDMPRLWHRAFLAGNCAKALAQAHPSTRLLREEAFTAGVLHCCGLPVLADNLPEQLKQAIANARRDQQRLQAHEISKFGGSYAQVGGYLLGLWNLPIQIVEAVLHHSNGPPATGPVAPLSLLVHAAHALLGEFMPLIEGVRADPLNRSAVESIGWSPLMPLWQQCVTEVFNDSKTPKH